MIECIKNGKEKTFVFKDTGEIIEPKYINYTHDDYIKDDLPFLELMSAKPPLNESMEEEMFNSKNTIAEEKLDGVRQSMIILEKESRIFSRRISKKTDWYAENTNSVPHLSRVYSEEYNKTIIDGEFRIDGYGFKEVSSTMNCNWDLAIERQLQYGFVTFHVFDIIYYKGVYVAKMPLIKRKELLSKVIKHLNNPYIVEEKYTLNIIVQPFNKDIPCVKLLQKNQSEFKEKYPNLFRKIGKRALTMLQQGLNIPLNKREWYEYIVANGGEGLMLKDKNGLYKHKRGRQYTKIKKWSSWDCVIMGFTTPTKEYNGEHLEDWEYWEYDDEHLYKGIYIGKEGRNMPNAIPVSKYYAKKWVGNLIFGVYKECTYEELLEQYGEHTDMAIDYGEIIQKEPGKNKYLCLVKVGDCSGFDEQTREYFTKNKQNLIGTCVEIKAQEVIDKKTGSLRHPDYLRLRPDKNPLDCTLKDHILNK